MKKGFLHKFAHILGTTDPENRMYNDAFVTFTQEELILTRLRSTCNKSFAFLAKKNQPVRFTRSIRLRAE